MHFNNNKFYYEVLNFFYFQFFIIQEVITAYWINVLRVINTVAYKAVVKSLGVVYVLLYSITRQAESYKRTGNDENE